MRGICDPVIKNYFILTLLIRTAKLVKHNFVNLFKNVIIPDYTYIQHDRKRYLILKTFKIYYYRTKQHAHQIALGKLRLYEYTCSTRRLLPNVPPFIPVHTANNFHLFAQKQCFT